MLTRAKKYFILYLVINNNTQINTSMTHITLTTKAPIYNKIVTHFNKQYANVASIQRIYINNGQVFAADFTTKDGIVSIASGSMGADKIIDFK
jgi:hypothetical protein